MKRRLVTMCSTVMAVAAAATAEEVVRQSPATAPSPDVTTIVQQTPPPDTARPTTAPVTPRAVDLAYRDAVNMLRRDILAAPFSPELTIGQAVGKLDANNALNAAILAARQPGGPRWRNAVCELRLELPGRDVASVLWDAGRSRTNVLGISSDAFARHINHLKTQTYSALGRSGPLPVGMVEALPPAAAPTPRAGLIPLDPPGWIRRQMDVSGVGEGSGLKGARAAEAVALSELRRQVEILPLSAELTIRQAGEKDERIDQAVRDALRRARVSRVDYGTENVTVRITLDLDHVWRALTTLD